MTDLKTLLLKDDKRHLIFVAGCMGLHVGASSSKKAIADKLADFMVTSPQIWTDGLIELDLRLLKKAVDAGREQWIPFPDVTFMSTLESLHAIEIRDNGYEDAVYAIVPDLYDAIAGVIDSVIERKEKNESFFIDKLVLGITNVYGVVPMMTFFTALDGMFRKYRGRQLTVEDTRKSVMIMSVRYEEKGNLYACTPFFEFIGGLLRYRKDYKFGGKRYAPLDYDKALASAENSPFCAYGADTPQGKAVLEVLRIIGMSEQEAVEELHYIWMCAQFPMNDNATEQMFSAIDDVMDHVGHFDEYEQFANAIVEYANSVPKWLLRGHTANEANMLKVSISTEEHEIGSRPGADDLPDYLSKPLPQPETATDISKYGIAIKRVRLNDPCPCGSGLTYGRCHGKHIN